MVKVPYDINFCFMLFFINIAVARLAFHNGFFACCFFASIHFHSQYRFGWDEGKNNFYRIFLLFHSLLFISGSDGAHVKVPLNLYRLISVFFFQYFSFWENSFPNFLSDKSSFPIFDSPDKEKTTQGGKYFLFLTLRNIKKWSKQTMWHAYQV